MVNATMMLTSATGIISLLDEPKDELRSFALEKLNSMVDEFWAEISEIIEKIEVLYEDESFKHRHLASLVASKVYYHLGSFEESLIYALGAGDLFDVAQNTEYVSTIISKCIDQYIKERNASLNAAAGDKKAMDPRLEGIVNRMFKRCFTDGHFRQAIGIAIETNRMDVFEKAIVESDQPVQSLDYAYKIIMSLVENRHYRNELLSILVKLYTNLDVPDYVNICQCLIFLDDTQSVIKILDKLVRSEDDGYLMAYQMGFDLYESATQHFINNVLNSIEATAPIPSLLPSLKKAEKADKKEEKKTDEEKVEKMETDDVAADAKPQSPAPSTSSTAPNTKKMKDLSPSERLRQERLQKLVLILSGETTIGLELQFLIRNNHSDLLILKHTKDAVRHSVSHTATVIANSIMHCGTTSDQFLRDNLDWLGRAVNWAKFTATASLGVIHKGHEKEALNLMQQYLPRDSGPGSGYTEGGGLYALGLIHANHGSAIIDYLLNQLKDAQNEATRHGGCLGLGLAAMGTVRQDIYEQLKFNLYQDDAVTGEAAGVAMGLVMLGSKQSQAIEDMVSYAQETQHEKILRGLSIGISLTMFGRLEEADTLIETLCRDKDALLRRSGMHTIAMAYCGTGNNKAIRKLLHVAVSDVNDDVRRAAVEAIGFILFRNPEQCPSVVSLLSESYNPNLRYGAAMALGICCAGTGNKEALALLEPMTNDPFNFVRQGALIASALILIQQTEAICPKVKEFRQMYAKVIADKHDDLMAKFGAIIAQGIIDAGGRNMTISLQSRTGHTNVAAVVGMLVFSQFWYWYPLVHFISLALSPTCLIALNSELKMPVMEFKSAAKPSLYAYPPPLEEKKKEVGEKLAPAVLSITNKQAKKKEKEKEEKMEVEEETKDKDDKKKTTEPDEEKKKEPEPAFELLSNPARVIRPQLKVIQMPESSRYKSIKDLSIGGIVLMRDLNDKEPEKLVEPVIAGGPKVEEEKEADPPEPFEYIED